MVESGGKVREKMERKRRKGRGITDDDGGEERKGKEGSLFHLQLYLRLPKLTTFTLIARSHL